MKKRKAIIIGAGPAGLTAADMLLKHTDIQPVILEMSPDVGGISRTCHYRGNRIDIGGHRFFSKSDRIMKYWCDFMPVQGHPAIDDLLLDRKMPFSKTLAAPDPEKTDLVMLIRQRLSRIFFSDKFYDYPLSLNKQTLVNLGPKRAMKIVASYAQNRLRPICPEHSLADFFSNRFGRELYEIFFKDYTEKVWGIKCEQISPEWGAQRIKGLSISRILYHAMQRWWKTDHSLEQKQIETSLIEQFLYPKLGPGQLWEEVAHQIQSNGARILFQQRVCSFKSSRGRVTSVKAKHMSSAKIEEYHGDYIFSSMPIKYLIRGLGKVVPTAIKEIASTLPYRDFITVGLLLSDMQLKNQSKYRTLRGIIPDNWIYIQDSEIKLARLQIFNNWSPYLLADHNQFWLGLEYFCNTSDELWRLSDNDLITKAVNELTKLGFISPAHVCDAVVIRVPKAYPAYFGSYNKIHLIQEYLDQFENLFAIGRNGMHRYNNQDHSMLAAMQAVDNIVANNTRKDNIWKINAENIYHEAK